MTRFSLPRVFNNYHFRVVFEFRPFPFLKRDHPLADHTQVYQSIFLSRQPIGDLSLASYPGHTSWLSLFGHVYRNTRGITRPLCRIHDQPNCGKKGYKIRLWWAAPNGLQTKLRKPPHHSFLSYAMCATKPKIASKYSHFPIHSIIINGTINQQYANSNKSANY